MSMTFTVLLCLGLAVFMAVAAETLKFLTKRFLLRSSGLSLGLVFIIVWITVITAQASLEIGQYYFGTLCSAILAIIFIAMLLRNEVADAVKKTITKKITPPI